MTPSAILSTAAQAGVVLSVRAGTVYAAPPGRLSPALVDEIRAHKSGLVDLLTAPPACTSCASPIADPNDVLCQACYLARRGPGRVLRFDPDRRRRTVRRLVDRACRDCHTTSWHVTPRGDAICQTCDRKRVVGTP